MAKIIIAKMAGEGEQWNIELEIPKRVLDPDSKESAATKALRLQAFVDPVVQVMDARMLEMNRRILDAMTYAKTLTPEAQMAVNLVFDIMGGRAQKIAQSQPNPEAVEADKANISAEMAKLNEQGLDIKDGVVVPISKGKKNPEEGV